VNCSACGFENPPGFKFCGECARPLGSEQKPVTPERNPRDYTPKHLAEQVDPEEWHRILNRFFEILTDGVHRFEGTVNQYTGDGIMALFGAPIAHEDRARRRSRIERSH
jgi:hypothetical protein